MAPPPQRAKDGEDDQSADAQRQRRHDALWRGESVEQTSTEAQGDGYRTAGDGVLPAPDLAQLIVPVGGTSAGGVMARTRMEVSALHVAFPSRTQR